MVKKKLPVVSRSFLSTFRNPLKFLIQTQNCWICLGLILNRNFNPFVTWWKDKVSSIILCWSSSYDSGLLCYLNTGHYWSDFWWIKVEQLHRIFKLCGTPSEDYWKKLKVSPAIRPPLAYKPRLEEVFREFPLSSLGLLYILLALDPVIRGSAASALESEVSTDLKP